MTDKDRIRLAEAMGWKRIPRILDPNESPMVARTGEPEIITEWQDPKDKRMWGYLPFNPFTNANDDYAVLEWMRTEMLMHDAGCTFDGFKFILHGLNNEKRHVDYQIGDYARAALKVIDDD